MAIDPTLPYDDQNIFAKILRGEIPNRTVYETSTRRPQSMCW
jgi:histidine triad (HIT) family protein